MIEAEKSVMKTRGQNSLAEKLASAAEDSFDLGTLGDELSRLGYGEFFACFNPLTPRLSSWQVYRSCAPDRLKSLIDLFLINDCVEPTSLPASIRSLLPGMKATGIVVETKDGTVMTPGLSLLPVLGNWLLCQPPQPNPTFYFGDDSIGLLTRTIPRLGGDCLDLCAGPGIQALHSARFARHVTAVELDPAAANLAVLNTRLNRLTHRIEVVHGDLYTPIPGRRFDTITANPPFIPYPENLSSPFIGHGGTDGLQITRRILNGLPHALSDTGTAHISGTSLSDGIHPLPFERLETVARAQHLTICLSVLCHKSLTRGSEFFTALVKMIAVVSGETETVAHAALTQMLASERASHICSFFMHVSLGRGQLDLINMARLNQSGFWYA